MDWITASVMGLLAIAATVGCIGLFGAVHTVALLRARGGLPAEPAAPAVSAMSQAVPPSRAAWHALPGQRLELGSTGWMIQLITLPGHSPYRLHTPEGLVLVASFELPPIKAMAERMAAERAEFEPCLHPDAQADSLRAMGAATRHH